MGESSNTVEILIRGVGGHGAHPEATQGSHRALGPGRSGAADNRQPRNDPRDPAVVTVGTIHGGSKANIIPDAVRLQLTVRSSVKRPAGGSRLHRPNRQGNCNCRPEFRTIARP